jgi:Zn-dependent peptidase ImmA (M78 family)
MPGRTLHDTESLATIARDLLKQVHARETQRHGWKPSPDQFFPVPLRSAVEVLGWTLEEVGSVGHAGPDLEPIHGLTNFEAQVVTIAIDNIPAVRRNFTLAHEIGHIVLHGGRQIDVARRVTPYRRHPSSPRDRLTWEMEQEADLFAAELLMPRRTVSDRFKQVFKATELSAVDTLRTFLRDESGGELPSGAKQIRVSEILAGYKPNRDTKSLQEFFGVSVGAMGKRLRELGHILP